MPPSDRPSDRVQLSREDVIPALEARERFLDAILGSLEAFLAVDEDWRVTYVNRAAAERAGAAAGDLLGRELWAVVPDLLDEAARDSLRRAMAERESAESESETPQGTAYHTRAYPLADGGLAVYIQDVSERRRREAEREQLSAALVASEQRYRSIVETTAEGIMIGDPDGTIVFANQRMADMLGYAVQDLVGMAGPQLIYPDWMPQVVENREALRHGEILRGEFKLRRKDGSALWTVFSSTPLLDRAGDHVGNLTMHTDISDRKRSEEALRQSEERLKRALSAGGIAAWDYRIDTGEVVWNPEHFRMLAYEADEVLPSFESFLARVHPDDVERVRGAFLGALERGEEYDAEFRVVLPDGELRWIVAEGHFELDAAGRAVRSYGVMLDVTGRVLAAEALRRSEERFRLVLGAAPVSVAAQDKDLRYVWAFNQRTVASDGVLGKTDAELFTPEEAARLTALKRRVLDEGIELREQLWLDGPQGRTYLDCTFMPLRDDEGAVTGVGNATVDLTPMKLAEEARRESEETLRSFYDSASLLMGVAELDGERIVPVSGNRAAEELLGDRLAVTPGDGEPRRPAGHGAAAGLERELVRRYLESEVARRPVRFEHQLDPDDHVRLLSFTVAHIASGTSGRPRFSFVAEDITERRRAEDALRERDREQAARVEKSRVARDLHDSVTQALFAASLKAEALAGIEGVPPDVEAVVTEVQRLNRGALAQMRTMLLELRGDPLEQIPLHQLVRNVVEATESRTRTRVRLTIEGDGQVPPVVHVTLYRVTQEALNNVARHAQADHAWVELRLRPDHARLTIKDDGRGFTPGPLGPAHLGLRSMRERAAEAGARFGIVAAPGEGTEVSVEWEAEEARPG